MATKKRELMDEGPASKYIDMSVAFLRSGRLRGVIGNRTPSPPYLQLGRSIKYDVRDLDEWLQARRVDPAKRKARAGATAA
jgi:hypothetical protein